MQSVLARLGRQCRCSRRRGAALGGGAEWRWPATCVAAETARIAFKQVSLGIMVGWGGGQRLLRIVGRARASGCS